MRHMPNLRMYARGRPHTPQRLRNRTWNFAGRFQRSIADVLAKRLYLLVKGIPSAVSSARASSSFLAVVTMVISIPRSLSILS